MNSFPCPDINKRLLDAWNLAPLLVALVVAVPSVVAQQAPNLSAVPTSDRFALTDRVWPANPGDASVCLWEDDKVAAVSFTVDDNVASQTSYWLDQAQQYGFGVTWFLVSDRVGVGDPAIHGTWASWAAVLPKGHDVQSHTRTDFAIETPGWPGVSEEYSGSKAAIEANLTSCLFLAYPDGPNAGLNDRVLAAQTYAAARGTGGGINPANRIDYFSINSGDFSVNGGPVNNDLSRLLNPADLRNYRGWAVVAVTELNPLDSLQDVFQFVARHRSDIWPGRFGDVAKYAQQRDTATLDVTQSSTDSITLSLTDTLLDSRFDYPLTIKVRLPDSWQSVSAEQAGSPVPAQFVRYQNAPYALVKAVPDRGGVILRPPQTGTLGGQTYGQWLRQHFLPPDRSGLGSPMETPAGDGIQNLVKYALGLDPRSPGLADRITVSVNPTSRLQLSFTRPYPIPVNATYVPETGSDLMTWQSQNLATEVLSLQDGLETLRVTDSESSSRRFMRLKIGETAPVSVPQNLSVPVISGTAEVDQTLTSSQGTWQSGGGTISYTYQWLRNGDAIPGATGATYLLKAADLGATVSIRVTASNSAGSAVATSLVTLPVLPAPVAAIAIRPDGWTADLTYNGFTTGGTYNLAPDSLSPSLVLTVSSPGFDDNGQPTRVQREVIATVPLRKPYPDQLSKTEAAIPGGVTLTVVLSDRIYSGDILTDCRLAQGLYANGSTVSPAGRASRINGSTLSYPKAVGNWCALPYERASGSSHTVEFLAFHRHPRNGRQVACVEFIATDESGQNAVSVKTSAMVASTYATGGNPVAVYRAAIPLAGLNQGQNVTVRAKVYPFIGDASSVLDSTPGADGFAAPTPNLTNLVFLNDKTGGYGTVFAYVTPGADGTKAAASVDASSAALTPFPTIQTAAVAIRNMNNTVFGHNDLGGGVIRLTTGSHAGFGAAVSTLPAGKTWVTVESAPGSHPDSVIFTTGSAKQPGNLWRFRNLSFVPAGTGQSHIVLDGVVDNTTTAAPILNGAWENVRFAGDPADQNPMIHRIGMRYFANCRFVDVRTPLTNAYGGNRAHAPLLVGCTIDRSTASASSINWRPNLSAGNIFRKGNQLVDPTNGANQIPTDMTIVAFNSTYEQVSEASFGTTLPVVQGAAFVQNLFERISTTSGPAFTVGRDGSIQPLNNIILQHNTTTGGRTNYLYNDTVPEAIPKNGVILYSILFQFNIKTDTFFNPSTGYNGNRIGNWEPVHGVGFLGNLYQSAAANGPAAPYYGPNSWNGSYTGRMVRIAQSPAFVNDQGFSAGNQGNGDYRLRPTSAALNLVPSGLAALPFDLMGTPRRNDGTGAAGAFEFVPTP